MTLPTGPKLTQPCWAPEALTDILDLRAAFVSDATFVATHHPATLRRRENYSDEKGTSYDEQKFHQDFYIDGAANLLVPVIGPSGSGKSHLIRWLYAQMPDRGNLHVVYVPKRKTNLRAVLQLIIEGLNSPEFNQFREHLKSATEGLTLENAMLKYRQALAYMITNAPDDLDVSFQDGRKLSRHDIGVHRDQLPYFLNEQVVVNKLDAKDGMIHRLMEEALEGRIEDKSEAFAISERDLPLDMSDIVQAGYAIQVYFADLVANQQYTQGALALLNYYRDAALREVYQLGGTELTEIMRQVREILKRQGKTLVLLIEDFALLQGIQKPLLEALIEDDVRDLCPIRVAFAVTTGFFRDLETVRTRLSFIVDLEITYNEKQGKDLRERLSARYLNAVRWGEQALQAQVGLGKTLRSRCAECTVRQKCHAAFGKVTVSNIEGTVGLYPFNTYALEVVNAHHQQADEGMNALNPRELLRGLSGTLREAQIGIPEGTFPTRSFRETYDADAPYLSPIEANKLDAITNDPQEQDQMKFVTRTWGGQPALVRHFEAALQEAFAYPDIAGPKPSRGQDDTGELSFPLPPEPGLKPQPAPPSPVEKLSNVERALLNWSNNQPLIQGPANDLRGLVARLINERLDFDALNVDKGLVTDSGLWGTQRNIEFEGQTNPTPGNAVRLYLPLKGQTRAQVARALSAYFQYEKEGQWPASVSDAVWQFEEVLGAWVDEVSDLIQGRAAQAQELKKAINGLYWIAIAQGRLTSETPVKDWLSVMIKPPQELPSQMPLKWARIVKDLNSKHQSFHRTLLTYAAVRKGTGKAAMIDAALVFKHLKRRRAKLSTVLKEQQGEISTDIVEILGRVNDGLEEVRSEVQAVQNDINKYLPNEEQRSEMAVLVRDALEAAAKAGITPFRASGNSAPADQLKTMFTILSTLPLGQVLRQADSILKEDAEVETLMDRSSRFSWADARRIQEELARIDELLSKTLELGASQLALSEMSGDATTLANTLRSDLQAALNTLDELQQATKDHV